MADKMTKEDIAKLAKPFDKITKEDFAVLRSKRGLAARRRWKC